MKINRTLLVVLCVACGYIGAGYFIGFFATTALVCVVLGLLMRRTMHKRTIGNTLAFVSLCAFFIAVTIGSSHYLYVALLIVFGLFCIDWKNKTTDHAFFLFERLGADRPWRVVSIKRRFVSGELHMDFTKGMFHEAETRIEADAWLGHIVCIVPVEVDVAVMAEVTAGDVSVADRHVSGLGHRVVWRSPHDVQARARLRIHIRCVIGTVRVQVRP